MTRLVVVERCVYVGQEKTLLWRWTCPLCGQHGEWDKSLNTAERDGAAHNRLAHEVRAVA